MMKESKYISDLLPVRRHLANEDNSCLQNYATITENGAIDFNLGHICMSSMEDERWTAKNPCVAFLDYPFNKLISEGPWGDKPRKFNNRQKRYLRWLVNKSPWRRAFLVKNLNDIALHGNVLNVNLPAKFVLQGAWLARYVAEFPRNVEVWVDACEYTSPLFALMVMHYLNYHTPKDHTLRFEHNNCVNSNHQAFKHCEVGRNELIAMMYDRPNVEEQPPLARSGAYRDMGQMWGNKEFTTASKYFHLPVSIGDIEVKIKRFSGISTQLFEDYGTLERFVREFVYLNRLEEI